jgi:hypothetical protein
MLAERRIEPEVAAVDDAEDLADAFGRQRGGTGGTLTALDRTVKTLLPFGQYSCYISA